MILATLIFTFADSLVKNLSSQLHPFVIGFLRNAISLGIFLPLAARNRWALLRTTKLKMHVLRGVLGALGTITYFYALAIEPLANATALQFVTPIFGFILAVMFLGERASFTRAISIGIAFAGVILVSNSSGGAVSLGALLVIASALLQALISILIKRMTATESPLRITVLMNWTISVLMLPLAIITWSTPSLSGVLQLFSLAALGTAGQYCVARALEAGEAGVVMPMEYTKLIWAAGAGFLLFQEMPSASTLIGGALIVLSALTLAIGGTRR